MAQIGCKSCGRLLGKWKSQLREIHSVRFRKRLDQQFRRSFQKTARVGVNRVGGDQTSFAKFDDLALIHHGYPG